MPDGCRVARVMCVSVYIYTCFALCRNDWAQLGGTPPIPRLLDSRRMHKVATHGVSGQLDLQCNALRRALAKRSRRRSRFGTEATWKLSEQATCGKAGPIQRSRSNPWDAHAGSLALPHDNPPAVPLAACGPGLAATCSRNLVLVPLFFCLSAPRSEDMNLLQWWQQIARALTLPPTNMAVRRPPLKGYFPRKGASCAPMLVGGRVPNMLEAFAWTCAETNPRTNSTQLSSSIFASALSFGDAV